MLSMAAGTLGTLGMTVGTLGGCCVVSSRLSPLEVFFLPAKRRGARFECRAGGCWLSPWWGPVCGRDERAGTFREGDAIRSSSRDEFFFYSVLVTGPRFVCGCFAHKLPASATCCWLHGVHLCFGSPALYLGKPAKNPHSSRVPVRGQSCALGPHPWPCPGSGGTRGLV